MKRITCPSCSSELSAGATLPGGFQWTLLNAGFNHQSNGRADPVSRSWNRLFAEFGVERENFALFVKAWHRIKEDATKDDNPDITDYLGYGELNALYRWRNQYHPGRPRKPEHQQRLG